MTDSGLYIVKVKRYYGENEVESVLTPPATHSEAQKALLGYKLKYQSTQYYIEKWDPTLYGRGFNLKEKP